MTLRTALTVLAFCAVAASGCSSTDQDTAGKDTTAVEKAAQTPVNKKDYRHPVRDKDNPLVTLETDFGGMTLELYRDVAPAHVDSFIARVRDGFYSGTIFHRVYKGFLIQGGNPVPVGKKQVSYSLGDELSDLPHQEGTLSMARMRTPNSAKTQFFICLARNTSTAWLDRKYTNFGQLIKGYDVLHAIADVPVGPSRWLPNEVSQPITDVRLIRAYLSDVEGNPLGE
ncbi:MAG TPA: peptidylprolyl isomerase [Acidobacteriota bacterium]|nr:peptidylprolyl isomerase [Acidobacteriota bacterium]